jgi:hypothetical protein
MAGIDICNDGRTGLSGGLISEQNSFGFDDEYPNAKDLLSQFKGKIA